MGSFDVADVDDVVAGVDRAFDFAVEVRQGAGDAGAARLAVFTRQVVEAERLPLLVGEKVGELLLPLRQQIDRKRLSGFDQC